jgi:fatty acid desaturase
MADDRTIEVPFTTRTVASYVHELKPALPAEVFEPVRSRVLLIPMHLGMITMATIAIAAGWVAWPIMILLSVFIGLNFAGLAFAGHEAMHGAIVKNRRARYVMGFFGFLPYFLSPRLWDAWHGRVHHANTNRPDEDPDGYPTIGEYNAKRRVRWFINWFSLGGSRLRGGLSLILGFTVQAAILLIFSARRGYLTPRGRRIAIAETVLGLGIWATVAALIGFVPFVLAFVLPCLIGNTVVMAFILTNHSLSPLTPVNDPLINGLSVTGSRWLEWSTLHFGLHVEHHLFPAMSSRHAQKVRKLILERWPERYQSMPLWRALLALHRTSRVYKDAITLVDPKTGIEYPTLLPGTVPG